METIKHLYIIGNGFDIHHRINSSYSNFEEWLKQNGISIYGFDEIFGGVGSDWWCDFENNMGDVDTYDYAMGIASENPPDLTSDHCDSTWNDAQVYVEDGLEEVYNSITDNFKDWILQLNEPDITKKISLKYEDSIFLTFNYTKTLEKLYAIPSERVLHIHGSIDNESFVIGHGKTIEDLEKEHNPEDSNQSIDVDDEEYTYDDEGLEIHEQWAYDAALNGVAKYRKPVENIIKSNLIFFDSLKDVTDIHVYGFSFSGIDIPYINQIVKSVNLSKVTWEVSDFRGENQNKIETYFKTHNITNYKIISLDDLIDKSQLSLF